MLALKAYLRQNYYQLTILLLILVILLLMNALPFMVFNSLLYFHKIIIFLIILSLIFRLKSSVLFFAAFVSLIIMLIELLYKNNVMSELFSITAYYLLAAGIAHEIISMKKSKKDNGENFSE